LTRCSQIRGSSVRGSMKRRTFMDFLFFVPGSGTEMSVPSCPRHRPGPAAFPHPVHRSYSHSRGPSPLRVARPSCYCPQ
jgi:hypothetical protein